jgi:hypothetical protein
VSEPSIDQLWKKGMSLQQIADYLTELTGKEVTRNSVSGKLYRMGAFERNPRKEKPQQPAPPEQPSVLPIRRTTSAPEEPESRRMMLEELRTGTCRWPTHDLPARGGYLYCGAEVVGSGLTSRAWRARG